MPPLFRWIIALGLAGLATFWLLTRPDRLADDALAGLTGDAARGEQVFLAGGCASCHAAPDAKDEARLVLAGGQRFPSPFGTFLAPNISPDPTHGIGTWSAMDLANAMLRGVSPEGAHYYPAFPYTSYVHVTAQDVTDLHAYLATLPATDTPSLPHEISFPFTIRRGLGLWKHLYATEDWMLAGDLTPEQQRGRYLVEGPGHCGECHTPRDRFGGLQRDVWLTGAPTPDGKGKIPGISPSQLDWSESDIAYYLETGFTPDFDAAGGHMASVVINTGQLPASDRAAIAAYLKTLPAPEG
ncbi:cytochrome c [Seohaeicola saemankumensis]|nr:cytochrome c [Seohaeicola saemankumensis]MCA0872128.1 cytochrome c [Seohaeicola saemankumensis]